MCPHIPRFVETVGNMILKRLNIAWHLAILLGNASFFFTRTTGEAQGLLDGSLLLIIKNYLCFFFNSWNHLAIGLTDFAFPKLIR